MKIDRLIGILSILLMHNEKVTAPYLAKKFEVSRRTINRDIEALCKAGIPIITLQGAGGGISISEGYKIDKTLLTLKDMNSILAGLNSLDSISDHNRYKQLIEKLGCESNSNSEGTLYDSKNHIIINLSSHYKDSLAPKINLIQKAIEEKYLIFFEYYCKTGESKRIAEPYLLVFEWGSWYVWSFCRKSMDFRMFKLNRTQNIKLAEEQFIARELPSYKVNSDQYFKGDIHLVAKFDTNAKWRLIDEYGIDCFKDLGNNELLFEWNFSNEDYLLQWILSFGNHINILEPIKIRTEYLSIIEKIKNSYEET